MKTVTKFLVEISVLTNHLTLKLKTNESYSLKVRSLVNSDVVTVQIEAVTVFGVRHAMETLQQLIWTDQYCPEEYLYILKTAKIRDEPKFPYRG